MNKSAYLLPIILYTCLANSNSLFSNSSIFDAETSHIPPRKDQGWIPYDRYRATISAIIGITTKKKLRDRLDRTHMSFSDCCRNDRYNRWL